MVVTKEFVSTPTDTAKAQDWRRASASVLRLVNSVDSVRILLVEVVFNQLTFLK